MSLEPRLKQALDLIESVADETIDAVIDDVKSYIKEGTMNTPAAIDTYIRECFCTHYLTTHRLPMRLLSGLYEGDEEETDPELRSYLYLVERAFEKVSDLQLLEAACDV